MENLKVIPNPWCIRATNPTNDSFDYTEGNILPEPRFLEFDRIELLSIFRNLEVSSINVHNHCKLLLKPVDQVSTDFVKLVGNVLDIFQPCPHDGDMS